MGNAGIDREEDHGYALPEPVARARFLARERITRRVEAKIVVAKCANRNKAFRGVLEPRVQAALRDARHDGGKRLTHEPLQVLRQLELLGLALRIVRLALHPRRVLADPAEVRRHLVEPLRAPEELGFQHAVHHKVGIAPDGTREVAVRRTREAVVAAVLLAIYRALHRAQHKRRDELALGAPARCGNRLLERMLASGEEAHGIDFPEPGELFKDGNELRKPL